MDNYRNNILHILIGLFFCGALVAQVPQGMPFSPDASQTMGLPPGMSPEKAQQFQHEMAEFQKEFEALSPQEQDEFFQSMDEAVKKIDELSKTPDGKELLNKLEKGTISDEELDKLIGQLVEEEKPKKEPIEEKKEEKPKEEKKAAAAEGLSALFG